MMPADQLVTTPRSSPSLSWPPGPGGPSAGAALSHSLQAKERGGGRQDEGPKLQESAQGAGGPGRSPPSTCLVPSGQSDSRGVEPPQAARSRPSCRQHCRKNTEGEPSGLDFGSQLYQLYRLGQATHLLWASIFTLAKWPGYENSKMLNSIHGMQQQATLPGCWVVSGVCVKPRHPAYRAKPCCRAEGKGLLGLFFGSTGALSPGLGLQGGSGGWRERLLRSQRRGRAGAAWAEARACWRSLVLSQFPALSATCVMCVSLHKQKRLLSP